MRGRAKEDEISIMVPRAMHVREHIAEYADMKCIDFRSAVLDLIDIGLQQHGFSLYRPSVKTSTTKLYIDKPDVLTTSIKISLTEGEYIHALELADIRGYDSLQSFYVDTLARLRGGKKLKLAYREFMRKNYNMLGGRKHSVTLEMPLEVKRRIDDLQRYCGNDLKGLCRLVVYLDLDEFVRPNDDDDEEDDDGSESY